MTFLADTHLDEFVVPHPYDWGAISAEAPAWATFLGLLGSGQLLSPADTAYALGLMQAVISDHRWGVLTPGPDRLGIGKNGWYLDEEGAFDWRINSAGFVDSSEGPLGVAPLVVVSLSRYPGELGMSWGVEFAHGVADAVVAWPAIAGGRRGSQNSADRSTSRTWRAISGGRTLRRSSSTCVRIPQLSAPNIVTDTVART